MAPKTVGKKAAKKKGGRNKSARLRGARENAKARRQTVFLSVFRETGNLTRAAEAAKVARRQHYEWVKESEEYREAFADAQEAATDTLEAEARRRALEGVEEATGWYQGQPGGYVRRYSDTLLIFLLKGHRSERFKDRSQVESVEADISDWTSSEDLPFLQRLADGEPYAKVAIDRARALAGPK